MHHPMDRQVFDREDTKTIDQAAALLMRKVRASVGDALMDAAHDRPALASLRCATGSRRQLPLRALQLFFIGAQALGARRPLASGEGRKTQQPDVNTYGFIGVWHRLWIERTRDGHGPFAQRRAPDGARFGRAFQRAMLHDTHGAHLREFQHPPCHLTAVAVLGERQRIVAAIPTEARKAWGLLALTTSEEGLEGQVNADGHVLQETDAAARQQQYGPNELLERGTKNPWRILGEQLTSMVMLVLGVGALIKALLGEYLDAGAIVVVVLLNAVLGFVQEYRAERAIAALKRLATPLVRVRRSAQVRDIPARDLVPGDVILLEAGNAIPADARLVEVANVRVQEASLTGESHPVEKMLPAVAGTDAPLGDRHNMLYLGTTVTYGRGTAVVTETGMRTELGRIAELIQHVVSEATPLQKRVKHLGMTLALASVAIVALVFLLGMLYGQEAGPLFLAGVAIAVAAMPEGLPAVLTITLALGAQRMLRRRALIRTLPAVETLGSVTTICSDKTGTLTENRMQVKILDVAGHTVDFTEMLHQGHPVLEEGEAAEPPHDAGQLLLLASGVLCNDAVLQRSTPEGGAAYTLGDPTEGALLVAAAHFGLWKAPLAQRLPRVSEVPFSSERKLMTTVHRLPTTPATANGLAQLERLWSAYQTPFVACTKGAVDSLLRLCTQVCHGEQCEPLSAAVQARITSASDQLV